MTSTESRAPRDGRQRRGVTVAGIAKLAGVSAPTVSKVINGKSDVAPGTRQRVEAILREHGYQRPETAGRAALLELVFHELESTWALEIIRGVERVARENDLAVVLSEMEGHRTPPRSWIERVLARRPTGIIAVFSEFTAEQQARFAVRGIPLVAVDPTGEPLHQTPSVGATNWGGGLAATRHLLELGHRRIAMISGPLTIMCSRARLDGYRSAMDAAQVSVDPSLVVTGNLLIDGGLRHGRELLRSPDPPTAIFAANDLQALGVYEAAREAGIRIPQDLSVVGFDDLPFTRWAGPPLTTVRQPLVEMAVTAANIALAIAQGERPSHPRVELATTLVVRQSTAPPRGV